MMTVTKKNKNNHYQPSMKTKNKLNKRNRNSKKTQTQKNNRKNNEIFVYIFNIFTYESKKQK